MGHAGFGGIFGGTRSGDILAVGLGGKGSGHKQLGLFAHNNKISAQGNHCRAPRAGSGNHRHLGDHTGQVILPKHHFPVGVEGVVALLQQCAVGIINSDHRRAGLGGQVVQLLYLGGMGLAHSPAVGGNILGKGEDGASVHRAVTCHHSGGFAAVFGKSIQLYEAVRVKQRVKPFACGRGLIQCALRFGEGVHFAFSTHFISSIPVSCDLVCRVAPGDSAFRLNPIRR